MEQINKSQGILWLDFMVGRNVAKNVRAMASQQHTPEPSTPEAKLQAVLNDVPYISDDLQQFLQ